MMVFPPLEGRKKEREDNSIWSNNVISLKRENPSTTNESSCPEPEAESMMNERPAALSAVASHLVWFDRASEEVDHETHLTRAKPVDQR